MGKKIIDKITQQAFLENPRIRVVTTGNRVDPPPYFLDTIVSYDSPGATRGIQKQQESQRSEVRVQQRYFRWVLMIQSNIVLCLLLN
jgi:hypothetical protein